MAQTMSQIIKLNAVVNVPITVVYRITPCSWKRARDRRVAIRQDGQFVHPIRFVERDSHSVRNYCDAWSVRERFLELKTELDFLDFLSELGHFSVSLAKGRRGIWGTDAFLCWQNIFRQFLKRSPEKWDAYLQTLTLPGFDTRLMMRALNDASDFRLRFRWRHGKHAAALIAGDIVTAIFATIYIDRLQGAKYGFCARSDCNKPFKIKSRHKRLYCDMNCAHVQGVRRLRAKQKKRAG
jgi:hypothetical protein